MAKSPSSPNTPPTGDLGKGLFGELKKVVWPNRAKTLRLTGVVLLISLTVAAYVGIIDSLLAKTLELIASRG